MSKSGRKKETKVRRRKEERKKVKSVSLDDEEAPIVLSVWYI